MVLTQARFFVPLKIGSIAMTSHRSPVFYSAYVRPTVGSQLQEKGKVCNGKLCTIRGNAVFQDNLDGLAYSIYLGGAGIKDDHLYELHLAEECNLSVDSVLFAKVRKYGNELEGLWVTGSSSQMSCNGGEGRHQVRGKKLVVIVKQTAGTEREQIIGCSAKIQ